MGKKRTRQDELAGVTSKVKTPECGNLYVTVNSDSDGPCEVFCHLGKTGTCQRTLLGVIGHLVGMALQYGVPIEEMASVMRGTWCKFASDEVAACPQIIANALLAAKGDVKK